MNPRNTWIVVTTINRPTESVRAIARLASERGWRVVVVGDTKTPSDWACPNVSYLSLEDQYNRFGDLARLIPLQHYCRKNLGYLYAIREGADCILETDDDNIPYESFGQFLESDVNGRVLGGEKWINIYAHFTSSLIWPRGLPLDSIHVPGSMSSSIGSAMCPIQQFLADGDPDVDAIWRMLFRQPVLFERRKEPIIVERGSYVPFNSQNTLCFRDAFPLLYLPCHVSFRVTDIWRSLVAQRVLWSENRLLAFHGPTVKQVRNEHDLMRDFRDEVDGYVWNREIASRLDSLVLGEGDLASRAILCWAALEEIGVLPAREMPILIEWLDACNVSARLGCTD